MEMNGDVVPFYVKRHTRNQSITIQFLELIESTAIDNSGDDLANVKRLFRIGRHNTTKFFWIILGLFDVKRAHLMAMMVIAISMSSMVMSSMVMVMVMATVLTCGRLGILIFSTISLAIARACISFSAK